MCWKFRMYILLRGLWQGRLLQDRIPASWGPSPKIRCNIPTPKSKQGKRNKAFRVNEILRHSHCVLKQMQMRKFFTSKQRNHTLHPFSKLLSPCWENRRVAEVSGGLFRLLPFQTECLSWSSWQQRTARIPKISVFRCRTLAEAAWMHGVIYGPYHCGNREHCPNADDNKHAVLSLCVCNDLAEQWERPCQKQLSTLPLHCQEIKTHQNRQLKALRWQEDNGFHSQLRPLEVGHVPLQECPQLRVEIIAEAEIQMKANSDEK